jgi:flagellar biosynthesis chaperone FliJ
MADSDKSLKVAIETDAARAISDQERYNATLEAMAKRTEDAARAAKELADVEASTARVNQAKLAATERMLVAKAETKAADEEIAKTVKVVSKEEVAAALASTAASEKAFTSKKQLKDMVKQLGHEFPILGQLGRLALNPIVFATAGITAAFALWHSRMKSLQELFVAFELPDLSPPDPNKINASAKAWEDYLTAIKKIAEEMNSVEARTARTLASISATAAALKQIEAANKTPPTIEDARAQFFAKAQAKAEYDAKMAEANELGARGLDKERAAGKITIAGKEVDAKNMEDSKAQADTARKALAELEEKVRLLESYKEGKSNWKESFQVKGSTLKTWMSVDDMIAATQVEIGSAKDVISAHNRRLLGEAGREKQRTQRDTLYSESAADIEAAAKLREEATRDWGNAQVRYGITMERSGLPLLATPTGVGGTVTPAALQEIRQLDEFDSRINAAFDRYTTAWEARLNNAANRAANSRNP